MVEFQERRRPRGLALIAAAMARGPQARLAASSLLFGALGNLWGTKGRHPGWILYAAALGLIAYGLQENL